MWEYMSESLFENLSIAKRMHDAGFRDLFLESCGELTINDDDFYEMSWSLIFALFPETRCDFNDDIEAEAVVLFDPMLDEFCSLCRQYERREHIDPEHNTFWMGLRQDAWNCFDLDGYVYDYDLRAFDGTHGRARFVLLMGQEFNAFSQVPVALAELKRTLINHLTILKAVLKPAEIYVLPQTEQKEAA